MSTIRMLVGDDLYIYDHESGKLLLGEQELERVETAPKHLYVMTGAAEILSCRGRTDAHTDDTWSLGPWVLNNYLDYTSLAQQTAQQAA